MAHIRPRLVGATYTSADESGDIHKFTTGLADLASRKGVVFRYVYEFRRCAPREAK